MIHTKRKVGYTISQLFSEYNVVESNIKYLYHLLDHHGPDILHQDKNLCYFPELKQHIIDKLLIEHQLILPVAVEYSLPNQGMLSNWIRSYKVNGYVNIEKKRGRPSSMKNIQNQSTKLTKI